MYIGAKSLNTLLVAGIFISTGTFVRFVLGLALVLAVNFKICSGFAYSGVNALRSPIEGVPSLGDVLGDALTPVLLLGDPLGVPSLGDVLGVPSSGLVLGVPSRGLALGVLSLGLALGVLSLGVPSLGDVLGVTLGVPSLGDALGLLLGVPSLGLLLGVPSLGDPLGVTLGVTLGVPSLGLVLGVCEGESSPSMPSIKTHEVDCVYPETSAWSVSPVVCDFQ